MTTAFSITRDSPTRLRAHGRIDFGNAAAALAEGTRSLDPRASTTFDLGSLESADSVTLAVLLAWAARVSARGGRIAFVDVPARLRALAHLSDAERLLGIEPSSAQA